MTLRARSTRRSFSWDQRSYRRSMSSSLNSVSGRVRFDQFHARTMGPGRAPAAVSWTTRRAPATVREVADERGRTALSPETNRASKTDPKDHTPKIQDSRACCWRVGCFLLLFFALPSLPSRRFARARTRRARAFPSSLAPRRGRRRLRRDVSGRQGRHRCVPQAGQGPRARRRSLRAVRSRRFAPSFPSRARDD